MIFLQNNSVYKYSIIENICVDSLMWQNWTDFGPVLVFMVGVLDRNM